MLIDLVEKQCKSDVSYIIGVRNGFNEIIFIKWSLVCFPVHLLEDFWCDLKVRVKGYTTVISCVPEKVKHFLA